MQEIAKPFWEGHLMTYLHRIYGLLVQTEAFYEQVSFFVSSLDTMTLLITPADLKAAFLHA